MSDPSEAIPRRRIEQQGLGSRRGTCPVCTRPATLTHWWPRSVWVGIEGCHCQGFFVRADLLPRVRDLSDYDRREFADRIRSYRALGHEAWVTTADGTLTGIVMVTTERPDRRAGPGTSRGRLERHQQGPGTVRASRTLYMALSGRRRHAIRS